MVIHRSNQFDVFTVVIAKSLSLAEPMIACSLEFQAETHCERGWKKENVGSAFRPECGPLLGVRLHQECETREEKAAELQKSSSRLDVSQNGDIEDGDEAEGLLCPSSSDKMAGLENIFDEYCSNL